MIRKFTRFGKHICRFPPQVYGVFLLTEDFVLITSKSIGYKVPINPDAGPEGKRERQEEQAKIDDATPLDEAELAEKEELLTQVGSALH